MFARLPNVRAVRLARAELFVKITYGLVTIPLAFVTLLMLHIVAQTVYANAHDLQPFQPVVPTLIEALGPILLWVTGLLGFRLTRGSARSWVPGAVAYLVTLAVAIAFRLVPFIVYVIAHSARAELPSGPVLP